MNLDLFSAVEKNRIPKYNNVRSLNGKYNIYELKNMTESELISFLNNSSIRITDSIDSVLNLTDGIPALVREYIQSSDTNLLSNIFKKATELIFRFKSNQQIIWLKAAAFFEEFDSITLKCFPEVAANNKIAFKFVEHCHRLSSPIETKQNFIRLNPKIRFFIKENIRLENPALFDEYIEHAESYSELKDFISELNEKELDTLRYLSFLSKFDFEFIKLSFNKKYKAEISSALFDKKDLLFDEIDGFYKIKDNVCTKIHKCNKFLFTEDLNTCNIAVHKMYDDYLEHLRNDVLTLENNRNILDESIFSFNDDITAKKKEFKELQSDLMKDENYLIEVKRTLGDFSNTSYIKGFVINLIVFIFFMLVAAHSQTIIPIEEESSDRTVKIIFYVVATIFGLISFGYLTRIAVITARNKEKSKVEKDIKDYETNRKDKQDYLQAIKKEIDSDEAEVHKLKKEKDLLDVQIDEKNKYFKMMMQ